MDGFLLGCSHGLQFYGKLGRVRPVSQAYYESEKLFFCRDLAVVAGNILLGAIGEISSERLNRVKNNLSNWLSEK